VTLARRLAESLRQARQDAGLTHAEMARRLKISRPSYTRLENGGQNTTIETLDQMCRALKCEVADLFSGDLTLRRTRRR
jgi:transcriptional regulator with XRE-family HTH domain